METDFIPFQIGMQYDNWEFDLEPLELAEYYEKYEYTRGDIKDVLGVEIEHIYLYFKLDILFRVEIVFKPLNPVNQFISLAAILEAKYDKEASYFHNGSIILQKSWQYPEKHLVLQYHTKT
ncbi:hypothetical protein LS482_10970 [Sinomicrobium kalidii]|uniref:hypothetical protein n=1 Tax=Sinomicrobium kalidii TaxID=2900738 RepID=UPI001E647AA0|nr:hypothetical protein [Sinomicrobium kalidii]UGU14234.1 hypothetical protein LS482_10970 [Sinomicrobium kalidii]